ncbi:AMP-binding protein [Sphingopyxis granuli]|uniref:AMP-binding protein n=1 Tax=Sphingopyxis granuli TaxID=267128 RepID=UPI00301CDA9A
MSLRTGSASATGDYKAILANLKDKEFPVAGLLCDDHPPEAVAYRIVRPGQPVDLLTYGELTRQSQQFASALASIGVGRGDRVATLMGKSRSYLVALLAIWRLGAVHVPLFTAFAPPAIAFRLGKSLAKVVVADASQASKLTEANAELGDQRPRLIVNGDSAEGDHDFAALMDGKFEPAETANATLDSPLIHIFTSGTTGSPKGVIVPVKSLASVKSYADHALGLRPDDIYWCAADPGWAYGLYFGILASLLTGIESVLLEGGFSAQGTFDVLADQGITNFAAAPTVYRAMRAEGLEAPTGLRLRCASSAGEPLTPDVNEWAVNALGVPVHDHYGQTETGMLINNHHNPDQARPLKNGSMGSALPGWSAIILREDSDVPADPDTVGRVAMDLSQSPLAWFAGYEGDAAKSAEKFGGDGRYYLTGDTGWMDSDGYFFFSSRDDDVIIMAGYRIGPFEIESVLATHEAVTESAVIAVPDEVRGEVMEAFVVLARGYEGSEALEKDLQQWVKTRYAAHAFPRRVHFVDELPKTPSGKVQRFLLKDKRRAELQSAG